MAHPMFQNLKPVLPGLREWPGFPHVGLKIVDKKGGKKISEIS
jgi:hypothetical protein